VQKQLETRELIKLKLQRSALSSDTTKIAETISGATGSILVDVMGHTFTLYKKNHEGKDSQAGRKSVAKRLH